MCVYKPLAIDHKVGFLVSLGTASDRSVMFSFMAMVATLIMSVRTHSMIQRSIMQLIDSQAYLQSTHKHLQTGNIIHLAVPIHTKKWILLDRSGIDMIQHLM